MGSVGEPGPTQCDTVTWKPEVSGAIYEVSGKSLRMFMDLAFYLTTVFQRSLCCSPIPFIIYRSLNN